MSGLLKANGNRREHSIPWFILVFIFAMNFDFSHIQAAEDYPSWAYATVISINTTSLNLTKDVYNFPLLVRLSTANFDFTLSKPDGTDIRFSKRNNSPLSFERERWDNTNNLAEFWVLVDTIYQNSTKHQVKIYWGKSDAADSSQPEQVFKTANGYDFAGVWHLSTNNFNDATSNSNHGSNNGSAEANGLIGVGKDFDGTDDYINCGLGSSLDITDSITIAGWIYPRTQGPTLYVLAKRDGDNKQFSLSCYSGGYARFNTWEADQYLQTAVTIPTGQWTHLAAVYSSSDSIGQIYVNGVTLSGTDTTASPLTSAASNTFIGARGDGSGGVTYVFDGILDEVRLAHSKRSADWIKLGYETQKSGQTVVAILPINIAITNHPQNDTVITGGSAEFSVTVSGSGIIYQWQRNDGGWHNVASGGTNALYSFPVVAGDDGVFFRCLISTDSMSRPSDSAQLFIASTPVITSSFSSDTALAVNADITLHGSATGIPIPTYEWFFISPASGNPVSIDSGATLYITQGTKADSGTYYFIASNKYGSVTSDSIFCHFLTPVSIDVDIPTKYNVKHGGTLVLRPELSGDGLFQYQWYQNNSTMPNDTNQSLVIDPVDSAVHNGNIYYLQVTNHLHGVTIGTVNSTRCTLSISQIYNPFKVKVQRIGPGNNTQVKIQLWSDISLNDFPTTDPVFPQTPWADSVWLFYKPNGYATSTGEASRALYSTEEIKQAAPNPLEKILTVGNLPQPHDSCFWFNYSIKWHYPDTVLKPFIPSDKVFMLDTIPVPNPLVVHGEYIMKTDTAKIHIDSISKLNNDNDSVVVIQVSKYPGMSPLFHHDTLLVSVLLNSGNRYTIIMDDIGILPIEKDTMYCQWYVVGDNLSTSVTGDTSFTIGWDRPVYTGTLLADSTLSGDQIHVSWTAPPAGTDSVRIWWDQTPIPLSHDPNLPISQAFYPYSSMVLTDTIKYVLTNNTIYYLGLQICKDDLWSRITIQSSDTVKTAQGNTDTIPNNIKIDSASFNSSNNSITLYWHLDLSITPPNSYLIQGYTYQLGHSLDTACKPVDWDSIATAVNTTVIPITNLIFDTTYTAGLWLRSFHVTNGASRPTPPNDSSKVSIKIPTFTWQAVSFFPDTPVVFAANKRIILQQIDNFIHHDTLWSFDPGPIPAGFVSVGGVCFYFGNKTPGIAPFKLGLRYTDLASGISENNVAMYQIRNKEFFLFYDREIKDSVVWVRITNTEMAYPFIILADTLKPQITVESYADTIAKGYNTPLRFNLKDNCANSYWQFKYGSGNEGYPQVTENYLTVSNDTSHIVVVMDSNVINESFGVRALIITSDGIHRDTINTSRCVKNERGEAFSLVHHEWSPLRTTKGLNQPGVDIVFDQSIVSEKPWKYDIMAFRIFRWHALDQRQPNKWLEYDDNLKPEFQLVPGRVIWCKTATSHALSLGSGVTTTLKEPYIIPLKPNNYTDISLPFQFKVRLRDALLASAPHYDTIDVYHWRKDGTSYTADPIYVHELDTNLSAVTDTLLSQQNYDAYTIYNHNSQQVMLKIPPFSLPLSPNLPATQPSPRTSNIDSWDMGFRWMNIAGHSNSFFKTVRYGLRQSKGETAYGPLPPTMSKLQIGIYNQNTEKICGWALAREYDRNNGVIFKLVMRNNSSHDGNIAYYLDKLENLPDDLEARIYNPASRKYENCTKDKVSYIDLASASNTTLFLVVGKAEYFHHLFNHLDLLKIYPNPFHRDISIRYRMPFGIKTVNFSLFNLQGQRICQVKETRNVTPGEHVFHLNHSTNPQISNLAAGVYILHLSAQDHLDRTIFGGKKRIFLIK